MNHTTVIRYSVFALVLMCLTSCSLLSPVKVCPPTQYRLNALPCNAPVKARKRVSILIARPEMVAPFDTTQIAYSRHIFQVAFFTQSRWAATPAQMFQALIVQALHNTHYYRAVLVPPYFGRFSYILNTQIVELLQDYSVNPPAMSIIVTAQITSMLTNQIVATKQFDLVEPILGYNAYAGVVAANTAMTRLLDQLALFCLNHT